MEQNQNINSSPYVGPRAFELGEKLYGRKREVRELQNLLIAERIVLLHSPSGAGKTSLIQADLIPKLRDKKKFDVLRVMRVGLEVRSNTSHSIGKHNRYVLSALQSLEKDLPVQDQLSVEELANLSLLEYLQLRSRQKNERAVENLAPDSQVTGNNLTGRALLEYISKLSRAKGECVPQVLIFDQFEEILTLNSTDIKKKCEFFEQVGEVLSDGQRWALFSMRDDFVAALEPYRDYLPTRLSTTYRLELLTKDAARPAIQEPVKLMGVEFNHDAAEKLIDDLSTVRIQRSDGRVGIQRGTYVEPVQLQVVCLRLWEKMTEKWKKLPDDAERQITKDDIKTGKAVNTALGGYYADKVNEIAKEIATKTITEHADEDATEQDIESAKAKATVFEERLIREWFNECLITSHGMRGQVVQGDEKSKALEEKKIIGKLENSYLVRAEKRHGAVWYELAHDRLIGPIEADNAEWFKDKLNYFQHQALLWEKHRRSDDFLLTAQDLKEAEKWERVPDTRLTDTEKDFLAACREARSISEREQKKKRITLYIAISVGCVLLVLAALYKIKKDELRLTTAHKMTAHAYRELDTNPERSLLLAVEAIKLLSGGIKLNPFSDNAEESNALLDAQEALSVALQSSHVRTNINGHSDKVVDISFSPDGALLASASADRAVKVWDSVSGQEWKLANPILHEGAVNAVAFSWDGKLMATGSADGTAKLCDADKGEVKSTLTGDVKSEIHSIAFRPDTAELATASEDGTVVIWTDKGEKLRALPAHKAAVLGVAFSPDGKYLATAGKDKSAGLWDAETGKRLYKFDLDEIVYGVAFSRDSKYLALACGDGTAKVHDVESFGLLHSLKHGSDAVFKVAFNPVNNLLAMAGASGTIKLCDYETGHEVITLAGHKGSVCSITFSPEGSRLASASEDRTAKVWSVTEHTETVEAASFSPDGTKLVTMSTDGTIILWDTNSYQGYRTFKFEKRREPKTESDLKTSVAALNFRGLAFSSDGRQLAVSDYEGPRLHFVDPWVDIHLDFRLPEEKDEGKKVYGVALSPVEKLSAEGGGAGPVKIKQMLLAAGREDGTVIIWNANVGGPPLIKLTGHTDRVYEVAFSPDGKRLATASADGTARVWTSASGEWLKEEVEEINASQVVLYHGDKVYAVAFDPDPKGLRIPADQEAKADNESANRVYVATAGADRNVKMWDAEKGVQVIDPVSGHTAAVNDVVFSSDGKYLATASGDGTAKVWEKNSPDKSITLSGHKGSIRAVAFGTIGDNPNDVRLVTASADRTVRIHIVNTKQVDVLLAQARRQITRSWSEDEYHLYVSQPNPQELDAFSDLILANQQARAGDIESAIDSYERAQKNGKGNPLFTNFKPEFEARLHAAEAQHTLGRYFAKYGNWEKAKGAFEIVDRQLSNREVEKYVSKKGEWNFGKELLKAGGALVQQGMIKEAIEAYETAIKTYSDQPDAKQKLEIASYYNLFGWYASFWTYKKQLGKHDPDEVDTYIDYVLRKCNEAISLDSKEAAYKDSLGVALAVKGYMERTRNKLPQAEKYFDDAIKQLQEYMATIKDKSEYEERVRWIDRLKRHEKPFTSEDLDKYLSP